jgi:hypothetical protein
MRRVGFGLLSVPSGSRGLGPTTHPHNQVHCGFMHATHLDLHEHVFEAVLRRAHAQRLRHRPPHVVGIQDRVLLLLRGGVVHWKEGHLHGIVGLCSWFGVGVWWQYVIRSAPTDRFKSVHLHPPHRPLRLVSSQPIPHTWQRSFNAISPGPGPPVTHEGSQVSALV